jgi:hypothetical protein
MSSPKSRTVQVIVFARRRAPALLIVALVPLATFGCAMRSETPKAAGIAAAREDIYVLRSVREERITKSDWCTPARAGFEQSSGGFMVEDRYTMWAVAVRSSDGQIIDASANKAGELHVCFGSTTDRTVLNFFTEGRIAGLPLLGNGNCVAMPPDFPEKGITRVRCYLELRGLPAPYVGGLLTTNSVASKVGLGGVTDPPGYVQSSIATIRLWRAP